jgi:hypothetical protein
MVGQARKVDELPEFWADMFMNWVLAYHYHRFGNPDTEVRGTPGWTIGRSYVEANAKAAYVVVTMENLLMGTKPSVDIDKVDKYVRGNDKHLPYQLF